MPANEEPPGTTAFSHRIDQTNDFNPTATKTQLSGFDGVGSSIPWRSDDRSYRSRGLKNTVGASRKPLSPKDWARSYAYSITGCSGRSQ
jgi:hypothetical protein